MTPPFDKTVTVYHKTKTAAGISWSRSVVEGVYLNTKQKDEINGNQRTSADYHVIIAPSEREITLCKGDIVIEGISTAILADNASGNDIIALGGWFVHVLKDNRYPDSGVGHLYGSDG